jgi:hypothetical protein
MKEDSQTPPGDLESSSPQSISQEHGKDGSSKLLSDSPSPAPEYLTGFKLWVTMVAMMLSIFLIAMDMVGALFLFSSFLFLLDASPKPCPLEWWLITIVSDHRCHLCPRHHQRIQRYQGSGVVRCRLLLDVWWFSINMGQDLSKLPP